MARAGSESLRARRARRYCRYTFLDRRICPKCKGLVHMFIERKPVQLCIYCRKHFAWNSAQRAALRPTKIPGLPPTLKYSGRGSPAMSTIEERSEPGGDCPRPGSRSSPIEDDERTPIRDLFGHSVDGGGNGNVAPNDNTKDGTVVSVSSNDGNQTNMTIPFPMIMYPAIRITSTSVFPHEMSPRPLSPRPTSPHPVPKKKRCSFLERFGSKQSEPREPREPRTSLESVISIPEVVPRPRAAELLTTLILARYSPGRGMSAGVISASPAMAPLETDGMLQRHATDLHDALARLEALTVDSSDGESASSEGTGCCWSKFVCFL